MSRQGKKPDAFERVTDMETPLTTIQDLLKAIALIAETMDDDVGRPVQRIAWLALAECKKAEAARCDLFRLTHPQRDHFEREGWPT